MGRGGVARVGEGCGRVYLAEPDCRGTPRRRGGETRARHLCTSLSAPHPGSGAILLRHPPRRRKHPGEGSPRPGTLARDSRDGEAE